MKAAVLRNAERPVLVDLPVPAIGEGEILIRTRLCGICGGEVVPWYVARKIPYTPGHEPVGVVERAGRGVDLAIGTRVVFHHHAACGDCPACLRGDAVHCPAWKPNRLDPGAMCEFVRVAREGMAEVFPIPDGLSDEAAVLVEPLACCVKTFRRGLIKNGERILLLGLGVMGVLHALLARARGVHAVGFDPDPSRVAIARRMGIETSASPSPGGFDAAIVGAAHQSALDAGFAAVRKAGRGILFAPFDPATPPVCDANRIFFDEIAFLSAYSCDGSDFREAIRLLATGAVAHAGVVTHRLPIDRVAEAWDLVRGGGDVLKVAVEFS